jgi:hypothetical protein
VSLILEALKKLERDKQVEARSGFLVMGARPWPARGEGRATLGLAIGGGIGLVGLGALASFWLFHRAPAPATAAVPVAPAAPIAASSGPSGPTTPVAAPAAAVSRVESMPRDRATTAPMAPAPPIANASAASVEPARIPLTVITSHGVTTMPADAEATAAPSAGPTAVPRFRLSAISQKDGKPVAVLNDRVVQEGDSFDDVTVVRIGDSEIELKVAGKPVTVSF